MATTWQTVGASKFAVADTFTAVQIEPSRRTSPPRSHHCTNIRRRISSCSIVLKVNIDHNEQLHVTNQSSAGSWKHVLQLSWIRIEACRGRDLGTPGAIDSIYSRTFTCQYDIHDARNKKGITITCNSSTNLKSKSDAMWNFERQFSSVGWSSVPAYLIW